MKRWIGVGSIMIGLVALRRVAGGTRIVPDPRAARRRRKRACSWMKPAGN